MLAPASQAEETLRQSRWDVYSGRRLKFLHAFRVPCFSSIAELKIVMSQQPPCSYMLWPYAKKGVPESTVRADYILRTYQTGDDENVVDLLMSDGESMSNQNWQQYRDSLLPNGVFVVEDRSGRLVATAGAVHNPNPGRYYFPFDGELGYLIVSHGRQFASQLVSRVLFAAR